MFTLLFFVIRCTDKYQIRLNSQIPHILTQTDDSRPQNLIIDLILDL